MNVFLLVALAILVIGFWLLWTRAAFQAGYKRGARDVRDTVSKAVAAGVLHFPHSSPVDDLTPRFQEPDDDSPSGNYI